MISLKEYYNKHNRNDTKLETEYKKRVASALQLPFTIKSRDQKKHIIYCNINEQYYNLRNEINGLKEKLNTLDDTELQNFLFTEAIKDEVRMSNEIENIRTSRRDMERADKLDNNDRVDIIKLLKYYKKINSDQEFSIKTNLDLSIMYQDLFDQVISGHEMIANGFLYRNDHVGVYQGNNEIHSGTDYKKLNQTMENLLDFMNDNNYIDEYVKIAFFHFYFGYTHPFFDGNGRTVRLMTAYYLHKIIGPYAFLLSEVIQSQRDLYYNAFEVTEDIFNKGDFNFFLQTFMTMIRDALKTFDQKALKYVQIFNHMHNNIKHIYTGNKTNKGKVLFVLLRINFFSKESFTTNKELMRLLELSESTIRQILNSFIKEGMVIKSKESNKFIYQINFNNPTIKTIINNKGDSDD